MATQVDTDDATESKRHDSGIDRVYRETLDLQLAIVSELKRSSANSLQPGVESPRSGPTKRAARSRAMSKQPAQPQARGTKQVVKRTFRRLLAPLKPIVRPLLGRIRRSMLEQWQFEVRQARSDLRYLVEGNQDRLVHIERSLQRVVNAASRQQLEELARDVRDIRQAVETAQQTNERQVEGLHAALESVSQLSARVETSVSQLSARVDTIEGLTGKVVRRAAVHLGGDEALVRTEAGYMICSTADPALIVCLMESGELEPGIRRLIERFLAPGDVFVDAGANIGMHTVAAARVMKGKGRVVSIEPFEPTVRMLRKSIALNGLSETVEVHQAALSDHTGRQTLYLGSTNAHHSLYPLPEFTLAMSAPVEVPLTTLDTIMASNFHADLIKIDVEGAELEVITGAHDTLARNPDVALIVEFGLSHLRRTGWLPTEWLMAFERLGFTYLVINEDSGALEQWSLEDLERAGDANLFFARPGASAWAKAGTDFPPRPMRES